MLSQPSRASCAHGVRELGASGELSAPAKSARGPHDTYCAPHPPQGCETLAFDAVVNTLGSYAGPSKLDPLRALRRWKATPAPLSEHDRNDATGFTCLLQHLQHDTIDDVMHAVPRMLLTRMAYQTTWARKLEAFLLTCPHTTFAGFEKAVYSQKNSPCYGLCTKVKRLRTFADALAPNAPEPVLAALTQTPHLRLRIPNDPFRLKFLQAPNDSMCFPTTPDAYHDFFARYNLAQGAATPTTQPLPHAIYLATLMHRAKACGLNGVIKNPLSAPLALEIVRDKTRQQVTVPPGGDYQMVADKLSAIHASSVFLNPREYENELQLVADQALSSNPWPIAAAPGVSSDAAPLIAPLIHFIWLGGALPSQYKDRILSFCALNPDHTVILWTDVTDEALNNVTSAADMRRFCSEHGIQLLPVQTLTSRLLHEANLASLYVEQILHRQYGAASDILRVIILKALGGTYVDADRTCLLPLAPLRAHDLVLWVNQENNVACNDFIMVQQQHPFLDHLLTILRRPKSTKTVRHVNFTLEDAGVLEHSGPEAFAKAFNTWNPRNRKPSATRLLGDNHLEDDAGLDCLASRGYDAMWTEDRACKQIFLVQSESWAHQMQRLTTCLLDDVRDFGSANIERYARYLADPELKAAVLTEVLARIMKAAQKTFEPPSQ